MTELSILTKPIKNLKLAPIYFPASRLLLAQVRAIQIRRQKRLTTEVEKLQSATGHKNKLRSQHNPLRQNSCRLKFLKKIKFEIRDENVYKVF